MEFDFGTNQVVDDITSVPEPFRVAYVEKDGKHVIAETIKPLTDAIAGLSGALKNERTNSKTLKGQKDVAAAVKDALGDLGIETLDGAKGKIEELTAAVAAKGNVDPAKIKAEIERTFDAERKGLQAKNTSMQATLEKYLVTNQALTAITTEKGKPNLLLPHITGKAKVVEEGGEYVVRVLDNDGQYRGDGKGGYMGVEALVKEMKQHADFSVAFESTARSGTQESNNNQNRPGPRTQQNATTETPKSGVDMITAGLAARRQRRGG